MVIINKKRIKIILSCILVGILAFIFQIADKKEILQTDNLTQTNTLQTAATPVSGKVIVIDAGHGIPEKGTYLLTQIE